MKAPITAALYVIQEITITPIPATNAMNTADLKLPKNMKVSQILIIAFAAIGMAGNMKTGATEMMIDSLAPLNRI